MCSTSSRCFARCKRRALHRPRADSAPNTSPVGPGGELRLSDAAVVAPSPMPPSGLLGQSRYLPTRLTPVGTRRQATAPGSSVPRGKRRGSWRSRWRGPWRWRYRGQPAGFGPRRRARSGRKRVLSMPNAKSPRRQQRDAHVPSSKQPIAAPSSSAPRRPKLASRRPWPLPPFAPACSPRPTSSCGARLAQRIRAS